MSLFRYVCSLLSSFVLPYLIVRSFSAMYVVRYLFLDGLCMYVLRSLVMSSGVSLVSQCVRSFFMYYCPTFVRLCVCVFSTFMYVGLSLLMYVCLSSVRYVGSYVCPSLCVSSGFLSCPSFNLFCVMYAFRYLCWSCVLWVTRGHFVSSVVRCFVIGVVI